jgi:hypothetical protein
MMASKSQESEGNRKKLTPRQERMAACLAAGKSKVDACRDCRVGMTTVYDWLRLPAFRERIEELRKELTDRAIGRLADLMAGKALDKLNDRLDRTDPETGEASVTLEDIRAAFELSINLQNAADLKARIEDLERRK